MRFTIESLTFDLLDDICLALESAKLTPGQLDGAVGDALGPLLELRQIAPQVMTGRWLDTGHYAALLEHVASDTTWYSLSGHQGIVRVTSLLADDLCWTNAIIRMKGAATEAGFSDDHAAKLVAAIGELYSNVVDHSELIASGYVAYSAQQGRFEFVVSDTGIGVLASLRTSPRYSQVADAGTALEHVLSEGVSRFADPGHGMGFRPLFVGLANVGRTLRFRSGGYGRIVERASNGFIESKTVQLAQIPGLLCSVLCDLN